MYRIIKAITKDGIDRIERIKEEHSLDGTFYATPYVGGCIYFVYNDGSHKMMASSTIEEISYVNGTYKIKTRNSEYWFKEIKDDIK